MDTGERASYSKSPNAGEPAVKPCRETEDACMHTGETGSEAENHVTATLRKVLLWSEGLCPPKEIY